MLTALVPAKGTNRVRNRAINFLSALTSTIPGPLLYNGMTLWKVTVLLVLMKEAAMVSLSMDV